MGTTKRDDAKKAFDAATADEAAKKKAFDAAVKTEADALKNI